MHSGSEMRLDDHEETVSEECLLIRIIKRLLDEQLGAFFRGQFIKFAVSFVSLVVSVVWAWAAISHRVDDMDAYGPKAFQAFVKEQVAVQASQQKADNRRELILIRLADKMGVRWDDIK